MRVNQLVAGATPARLVDHRLGQLGKQIEEPALVDLLGRADREPGDPAALGKPHSVWAGSARAPGEDFGGNAAPAQFLADRPQIDIHPAVFTRPQGSDRRGMHADDRERFQSHPPWCGGRTPLIVAVS